MNAGFVDIYSTGLPLRAVAHRQGSERVTRASYWPPGVDFFGSMPLRWTFQIVNVLQVRISFSLAVCCKGGSSVGAALGLHQRPD